MMARVSACPRKKSLATTNAGLRPGCSRPRTGSSSAQTTMPRRSSGLIEQCTHVEIPRRELIPVLGISAAERSPKRIHAATSLVRIKQALDQPCSRKTALLRIAVDAIPQLGGNLDRRHARPCPKSYQTVFAQSYLIDTCPWRNSTGLRHCEAPHPTPFGKPSGHSPAEQFTFTSTAARLGVVTLPFDSGNP